MDFREACARIIGRQAWLIVGLMLVGLLAAWLLNLNKAPEYAATARFVLDNASPATQAESIVTADTARALATSPELVQKAIQAAGVPRNARDVAARHVSVRSLGSSGVLQLTVTDTNPAVAVPLANAVADATVSARRDIVDGNYRSALADLTTQAGDLQRQITSLDASLRALAGSISPTPGLSLQDQPWTRPSQMLLLRADLVDRLGRIESEIATMQGDRSAQPQGRVVDAAAAPTTRVDGSLLPDLGIGALLGLLIAVTIAAVIESLRPTLVGRDAIARAVDAPVLAEFDGPPETWQSPEIANAAVHIELATVPAKLDKIALVSLARGIELSTIARALDSSLQMLAVSALDVHRGTGWAEPAPPENTSPDAAAPRVNLVVAGHRRRGLVIIVPNVVRLTELNRISELTAITAWPLLGLIVFRNSHGGPRVVLRRQSGADGRLEPSGEMQSQAAGME